MLKNQLLKRLGKQKDMFEKYLKSLKTAEKRKSPPQHQARKGRTG